MEKEKRRRCVRRQQEIKAPVDRRNGTEQRAKDRRSGFDRRIQQMKVSKERRTNDRRRAWA